MAFLDEPYSVEDLPEGRGEFELIPAGWYNATIAAADLSPTKDGTGQYIKLRLDITGPTHEGRVVFANLNIKNASTKAEEIGLQQLGDVMRAIGLSKVRDTDQLVGGNLQIKIGTRPAKDGYEAQNEVKGYKALEGGVPPKASTAPAGKNTPPWAKK